MRYEELLPAQLSDCVAEGRPVVIPVSQLEPQGDLLPLGADKLIIEAVLREAAKMVNFVYLPTFHIAACTDFRYWPGLIHFKPETTIAALLELAQSLLRIGFKKLIFVMYYGGHNFNLLDVVMGGMNLRSDQLITLVRLPALAQEAMRGVAEKGISAQYPLLMHVRPDLVDKETLQRTEQLPTEREAFLKTRRTSIQYDGSLDLARLMPQGPASGFKGAKAEMGGELFQSLVERFVVFIQQEEVSERPDSR
jgi:creatinine amidohydrolase/Fe(II)-dependent formamide hydrolase-like protein